ncbi:hypothetical protein [Aurantiacibacter odishensis]|uniref:hypothetical protein n=1 Tax=Aurantiacibacter odishensis TaxID=1155476 RepID=UPI0013C4EA91|nr:hypothetical protein [Aurantiacibacter odishensis]
MRNCIKPVAPFVIAAFCVSCGGKTPETICNMPHNPHFWQGVDIDWTGEVMEVVSGHGSVTGFIDKRCGWAVGLGEDRWINLYPADNYEEYMVVAEFSIQGRIVLADDRLTIIPSKIERLGPWMTEDNGLLDTYWDESLKLYEERHVQEAP